MKKVTRYILLLFFLFFSINYSFADERYWETELELEDGRKATLYWVDGHCAPDILYKIKVEGTVVKFMYSGGHPYFNIKHNLLALNHCEEGHCDSTINLFDLKRLEFLQPIELDFKNGSIAVQCSWDDRKLIVDILNFHDHKVTISCSRRHPDDKVVFRLEPVAKEGVEKVYERYEYKIDRKFQVEKERQLKVLQCTENIDESPIGKDLETYFELAYKASSTLRSQGNNNYLPKNVGDSNSKTAWIEGDQNYGIKDRIEIHLKEDKYYEAERIYSRFPLKEIKFVNGYGKNNAIWRKNSRVKRLKFYLNTDPQFYVDLIDTITPQSIELKINERIYLDLDDRLVFEIESIYPGSVYKDTAISEIKILKGF